MARRCIGFGEFEGKCPNVAGTPWTPLWCLRCDELRRAHITRRLEALVGRATAPKGAEGASDA
ncbi:MAG TPA: hypothetical protein VM695_10050 [Phycisphaerae bacterium]|nr:hypothetical protein [Phycisphaerae bacterium]